MVSDEVMLQGKSPSGRQVADAQLSETAEHGGGNIMLGMEFMMEVRIQTSHFQTVLAKPGHRTPEHSKQTICVPLVTG